MENQKYKPRIDKIKNLAYNLLSYSERELEKVEAEEQSIKKFLKIFDRLARKAAKKDKTELYNVSNYEVFKIFVCCINNDDQTYDKLSEIKEAESIINNFNYQEHYKEIEELSTLINDDGNLKVEKAYKIYANLRLPSGLLVYNLKLGFAQLYNFLEFKYKYDQLNIKFRNNSLMTKNQFMDILNSQIVIGKEFVDIATMYKNDITKLYREAKETVKLNIRSYSDLIKLIQDQKIYNLSIIPSTWEEVFDNTLLIELYDLMNEKVIDKYSYLEDERKKLKEIINKTPLTSYLYSHNINPENIDKPILEKLEKYDIEAIKKISEFLLYVGFDLITIINNKLFALYNEELMIQDIYNRINLKQITIKTLNNLIKNNMLTTLYKNIKINSSILETIIDYDNMFYEDKILLIKPEDLRNRISVLKEYNLTNNIFIFPLCNYNYINIYDLMLEKEIPLYLFISICKSENPLLTIKKIIISREINHPYEDSNHFLRKEIKIPNKFFCPDEEIDLYIENVISSNVFNKVNGNSIGDIDKNEFVINLDNNFKYEDLYIFGNTKISRPKTLKNLQKVNELNLSLEEYLFLCLTENSLLSDTEIIEIKKSMPSKKLS